jgi:hypothetical protein
MAKTAQETVVPEGAFSDLLSKLEIINNSFDPAFTTLSPELRKTKNAVGLKRRGFVEAAHMVAMKNIDYVPNYFDIDLFDRQMTEIGKILQVHNALKRLTDYVKNAEIILGHETYKNALSIHRYLREASKSGVVGAKPLYQKLKKQFPNGRRQAETEEEAVNSEESVKAALS